MDEPQRVISIDNARHGPAATRPGDRAARDDSNAAGAGGDAGELSEKELGDIVEALLFASASPLSASRINDLVGLGGMQKAESILQKLQETYDLEERPCFLQLIAGGYQIRTRPRFQPWVSKLHHKQQEDTLSQAALETLSIIAYRQPVTRADIEDIRGVQSGYILRSLIEKSLVRVAGRSEQLGRPLLYGTTQAFLEAFGLPSLRDLPPMDDPATPAGRKA